METVANEKWSRAPGLTVKALEVPVLVEEVAVMESVPELIRVTDCDARTPDTKADEVVGEMPPKRLDRVTVEAKEVTVLLFTSLATILILNGAPAV